MNKVLLGKFLITMLTILASSNVFADHPSGFNDRTTSIFYTYEGNGYDYIAGFGAGLTLKNSHSNWGIGLTTTFSNAEVRTEDGYIEEYFAWEGSVRFGHFSQVSIYGEVGIDLTEMLFHDLRYDHDDYHNEYHDDLDAYVGVGAGFNLGPLKVEAFTRLREIDSLYWEARSSHFTGVQFSINF